MLSTTSHFNQFKMQTTPSVHLYKPPCLHLCTLIYILFPYMQFLCCHPPLFLEQYEFSMLSTLTGFYNFAPLF